MSMWTKMSVPWWICEKTVKKPAQTDKLVHLQIPLSMLEDQLNEEENMGDQSTWHRNVFPTTNEWKTAWNQLIIVMKNLLLCVESIIVQKHSMWHPNKITITWKSGRIKNIFHIFSRNYTKINIVILHPNATHKTTYTLFNI